MKEDMGSDNRSLKSNLFRSMLVVSISSVFLLSIGWIVMDLMGYRAKVESMKKEYVDSEKTRLVEEVSDLVALINIMKDEASERRQSNLEEAENEIQRKILNRIVSQRFDEEGYFFGSKYNGDPLFSNGVITAGTGNLLELEDPSGIKIIQEQIRAARGGGGFVSYSWRKLTGTDPAPKLSYVVPYREWDWVLGAGVYLDDIETALAEARHAEWLKIEKRLSGALLVVLFLLFLSYRIAAYFSRQMTKSINVFSLALEKAGYEKFRIDENHLEFEEFRSIAVHVNEMISIREKNEEKIAYLKKMESLGLMAGGVAHDLNNVLSGIVSYPELILSGMPEDDKMRRPLTLMKEAGERAVAIIQDLLTIAQGTVAEKKILSVNDVVAEYMNSSDLIALRDRFPGVLFSCDMKSDLLNINGSETHMRKLLMNLVTNATEAIEGTGHVTVSTENRYFDRPVQSHDKELKGEYSVLSVKDNGSGMTEEDITKIFDPFFSRKKLGRSGTGLGLSIVWSIVADHGGTILVQSGTTGTLFEVFFPSIRGEVDQSDAPVDLSEYMGNGEKILIIDDLDTQREISAGMLEKLNYRIFSVSSGEEAVEFLMINEVDLLLLDMIMDRGMNGFETYREIIRIRPGQKAVIMSGYAEKDDVSNAMELGAGKYIRKPVMLADLAIAVKEVLSAEKQKYSYSG